MIRAIGTGLGLVLLLAATLWAFGVPPFEGIKLMAEGAGGDAFGWSRTAVKSTPLLLTGLGMIVAWRAGMYNIGGEGQFLMGGLLSATLARLVVGTVTPAIATPCLLLASMLGGAAWAAVAGWLSIRRGVDVVIGTILLNFIALQTLAWAVNGPLREKESGVPLSPLLPDAYMLPRVNRQMDAHLGVVLAILAAVAIYVYLYRTKAGFNLRLSGESARVARANRIDANSMRIQAMLISGALCGLAGGIEYVAMARQLGVGFSQNWGFLGIPVALVSGLQPLVAIPTSLFFGALFAGSENLARFTSAGPTLIYIVQAAAVLGIVGLRAFQTRKRTIQPDTPVETT